MQIESKPLAPSVEFFQELGTLFLTEDWRNKPLYVSGVQGRLTGAIERLNNGEPPKEVFGITPRSLEMVLSTLLEAFHNSPNVLDFPTGESEGSSSDQNIRVKLEDLRKRKSAQDAAFRGWLDDQLGDFHTEGSYRFEGLVENLRKLIGAIASPHRQGENSTADFNMADPFSRIHYINAINKALVSCSVFAQIDSLIDVNRKLRWAQCPNAGEKGLLINEVSMDDRALQALGVLFRKALTSEQNAKEASTRISEIEFHCLMEIVSTVEEAGIQVVCFGTFGDGLPLPLEIREQLNGLPPSIGLQINFEGKKYSVVGILASPKGPVISSEDEIESIYLVWNEELVKVVSGIVTPPPLPIKEQAEALLSAELEYYREYGEPDVLKNEPEVRPHGDPDCPFWVRASACDVKEGVKVTISVHDGHDDSETLGPALAESSYVV